MTLHDSIKKKIEEAFAAARVPDVANTIDTSGEISIEDPIVLDNLIKQIPHLPMRGHAASATVGRHRGAAAHRIKVPKADAATLIARAVKAMKKK